MIDETLRMMNPHWTRDVDLPGLRRDKYLDRIDRLLKVQNTLILYGLRRVGKTTLMRQYLHIMSGKLDPKRLFFATMDHPEVANASILDLLREFRRLTLTRSDEPQFLFLDEVQKREGFEKELKMIVDLEPNVFVLASGSSSLAIKHSTPSMTGRYSRLEVRPLDFREYLMFRDRIFDPEQPALMEGLMDDYLIEGGMPAYIRSREPSLILDLVEDIIYKDILTRYSVEDPKVLKDLFYLLMNRVGKPLSYARIGRLVGLGIDTVKRYLGYFEETYLVHLVERDGKPNERKYSPKKVYSADNGITVVISGKKDIGPLAENLAFLDLFKREEVRYISTNGKEVDFALGHAAFEVKYKDEIREEELEMLRSLPPNKYRSKTLITRRALTAPLKIKTVPLWELNDEIN
ncbi:MAG: ATP-binding protein [Candidatus Thermoplasmatota archaeon]|nr:ATP-binding protein [Candidatus Thermoplasmatota archaeon]